MRLKTILLCLGILSYLESALYAPCKASLPERTYTRDFHMLPVHEEVAKTTEYDVYLTLVERTYEVAHSVSVVGESEPRNCVVELIVYAESRKTMRPYDGMVSLTVESLDAGNPRILRHEGMTADDWTARFMYVYEHAIPAKVRVRLGTAGAQEAAVFEVEMGSPSPSLPIVGLMFLTVIGSAAYAACRVHSSWRAMRVGERSK